MIINVTDTLDISGEIESNGEMGWDVPSFWAGCGGGSGGSIFIQAGTITGSGNVTAYGADGNYGSIWDSAGGGGGGRIAIYFGTSNFDGLAAAYGGKPGPNNMPPSPYRVAEAGGAGTVYIKDLNEPFGNLTIDNNNRGFTGTPINGSFEYLNISAAGNVTIGGGAFLNVSSMVALETNASLSLDDIDSTLNATQFLADGSSIIINNGNITFETFDFLSAITLISNGITNFSSSSFENVTIVYQSGTLELPENNLTLGNQSGLEFRTSTGLDLNVVELLTGSTISHTANKYSQDYVVNISAINFSIATNAGVLGDSRGYAKESGPGNGTNAESENNVTSGAGGGYGGYGGNSTNNSYDPLLGGAPYGSKYQPLDLGSGGGNSTGQNTEYNGGGGLVFLNISDNLTINGYISINGSAGAQSTAYENSSSMSTGSGGGSGGSIYIITNAIYGTGDLLADGGQGGVGQASRVGEAQEEE